MSWTDRAETVLPCKESTSSAYVFSIIIFCALPGRIILPCQNLILIMNSLYRIYNIFNTCIVHSAYFEQILSVLIHIIEVIVKAA